MPASIHQSQSADNFFMNKILIRYSCSKIFKLCRIVVDFINKDYCDFVLCFGAETCCQFCLRFLLDQPPY